MKRSRLILTSILGLSLLGGLFSCGDTTVTSSDSTASGTSSSAASGTITVNFWHTFSQTVATFLDKKIEAFEKLIYDNEGVNVDIVASTVGSYDTTFDAISRGMPTGNMPTIAVAYPDHVSSYISAEGTDAGKYVVNLADYADDEKIGFGKEAYLGDTDASDFISAFIDEGKHYIHDGMYSLPFLKSTEVMYYNADMTAELLPAYDSSLTSNSAQKAYLSSLTWDEFMKLCAWIKDNYASKSSIKEGTLKWPAYYDDDSNLFISKAYQNNGGYLSIDADGKGKVDFDSTTNRAFVEDLKTDYNNGLFSTKGLSGQYGSNYFTANNIVFDIGSSGGATYQDLTSGNVGVVKVPYDNDNPLYVSQGPTLCLLRNPSYSDSENDLRVKYGWKFIKYLTSTDIDAFFCVRSANGYVPVRTSSYETTMYKSFMEDDDNTVAKNMQVVSNDVAGHYLVQPYFAGSAYARDEVGGIVTAYLKGTKGLDTAFADAINNTKKYME